MAAAIIELDSLPDAVWPGTKNHDLPPIGRVRFALFFVGRIKIWREGLKLGATRIDAFIDRKDSEAFSMRADFLFRAPVR